MKIKAIEKSKKFKKYEKFLEDFVRKDFRTPIIEEFIIKNISWELILGKDLYRKFLELRLEELNNPS